MTSQEPSRTASGCPPHYWLIKDAGGGVQQWTCGRCGAEREHSEAPAEPPESVGGDRRWARSKKPRFKGH
jgi:hypothetical protein